MTKRLLLSCCAISLALNSGCLFSRKSAKPKENAALAAEVESSFRQRWVDRRVTELTGKGVAAEAARAQALAEFKEQYSYMTIEQKK